MGYESSPDRRRRHDQFLKRQERRWAKKSGPVTVRFVDPATLRPGAAAPPTQPRTAPERQPPQ